MNKSDGKDLEKIVLLIERSLDSNARMEHDVQMPILNSPSGTSTAYSTPFRNKTAPILDTFQNWCFFMPK